MLTLVRAAFFIRHFEKNSRTKKLKTQEKNSITQGKKLKVSAKSKTRFAENASKKSLS